MEVPLALRITNEGLYLGDLSVDLKSVATEINIGQVQGRSSNFAKLQITIPVTIVPVPEGIVTCLAEKDSHQHVKNDISNREMVNMLLQGFAEIMLSKL
jgi:hypothetical protein